MDWQAITSYADKAIYSTQAALPIWGIYCVIFSLRQIQRRKFRSEEETEGFLSSLRNLMEGGDFDSAVRLCEEPSNLYRSLPILARTAMLKRHLSPGKLRQVLAAKFGREMLGQIENARATINTIAKSEPMLGLLGTVVGMIGAFSKMSTGEKVSPQMLAEEIGVALYATAIGLLAAVPLVLASSFIEIRMRSMEDSTIENIQVVLDDLEAVTTT